MSNNKIHTSCPTCKKADTWQNDNKFKPFCSERCKLIDLGAWASEGHRIAGEPASNKADESLDDSND